MMENLEENLGENTVLENGYNQVKNDDFFYDDDVASPKAENEFIDTNDELFSNEEVESAGIPASMITPIITKEENFEDVDVTNSNDIELGVPEINEEVNSFNLPKEEEFDINPMSVEIPSEPVSENASENTNENIEVAELPKENEKNTTLDDSYVLSNFDVLFDSLYSDVTGANNFISNLIEQKKSVNLNEANLNELHEKLEREKEEFNKYIDAQKKAIESEKSQCNEYVRTQHVRLQNEEDQFNADVESTKAELNLAEQTLKIANEKFEDEKEQFEKYKQLEEEKINTDKQKLAIEKEQFEKDKTIAFEKIKNGQKELQIQKEQFAKSKELEEKKLELESKNLSQSCARFKELVSQFSSGFQQLPADKD